MSFKYLWQNRARPSVLTHSWFKGWAKRGLNFIGLLAILRRRLSCQALGAVLGPLSVVGKLDLNGPAKNLSVGERSFIGSGVHLALHNNIVIGDRVVINDNVRLLTASHDTQSHRWAGFSKPIKINDYAWIATCAIILPGVIIGKGAVVGAGAVVSKDVPDYTIVAGNPAVKVGMRNAVLDFSPVDLCASFEAWLGH